MERIREKEGLLNIVVIFIGVAAIFTLPGSSLANCLIIGNPTLAFGIYDAASPAPTDTATTFTVFCPTGIGDPVPDTITVSLGPGGSYLAPDRRMVLGSFLNYNVFKDGTYISIWGDGTTLASPVTAIRDSANWSVDLTMYGSIPSSQALTPGIYTDNLTLTLSYGVPLTTKTKNVVVTAEIVGTCSFSTSGSIAFGSLDPVVAPPVAGAVVQPAIQCSDTLPYTITDNDGLWETGIDANRMQDSVTGLSYIPYSMSYTAVKTGTGVPQPMDISANIAGGAYAGAPVASYNDTVTLTVTF